MNTPNYLNALENFIDTLYRLRSVESDQIFESVAELCPVLRLGKVETLTYENASFEHFGLSTTACLYDSGNACSDAAISERTTAIDEKIIFYNIYAIEGEPEWTEEERKRINIFIAVLSTFSGKSRLDGLVYHMTYYDDELDIYNFKQFMKCTQVLCISGQISRYTAVRFNLKRFSVVNQDIGRENGTLAMKAFINLVDKVLDDENELVARIGGDNFIALVKSDNLQSVVDILAGTNVSYGDTPNERVFLSATVGVYIVGELDHPISPTDVMDRVSLTFQTAKDSPETDIMYFDNDMLQKTKKAIAVSSSFPKALEQREFIVYYQPKVDIGSGHIAGAEALCRWVHDGRIISPAEFIPVLEASYDICKLDFYMLDAVCRDIRRWLDAGRDPVPVSVNLSRRHLSDIDLLKHIVGIIDLYKIPHKYIEMELTETSTDVEFKTLKHVIKGLQQANITASVDDFGIGYSSLNLIKDIPWKTLKLDKSLLPDDNDDNPAKEGVLLKYIVAMAHEIGLECVAEGVETKEHLKFLKDNKCTLAQGFYFDKPLPAEEFETRLDEGYTYNL